MIPNRVPPNIFADVKKFLEIAQPELISAIDQTPKEATLKLAEKLVDEEVNKEFMTTLRAMIFAGGGSLEQKAQLLDDALDSIYVLAWTIAALSLPGEAGWNEIQRANMSKFPEIYGDIAAIVPAGSVQDCRGNRIIFRNPETGKVMKPTNFVPPNIFEVLHACISIHKFRTMPNVIATPYMNEYFHTMEDRREKGEIQL